MRILYGGSVTPENCLNLLRSLTSMVFWSVGRV